MNRILIVSAFWAPHIHVAANRALAFAKYFKKAGYQVTVLTLLDPSHDNEVFVQSNEFDMRIIRLNGKHLLNRAVFNNSSSFIKHNLKALKNKILNRFVVDDSPGFYFSFLKTKEKLHLSEFDFVLSSYAPLSAHLIALNMKLTDSKLTWIADFRDEMSFLPGLTEVVHSRLLACEKQILKECDIVTSVSEPLLNQFRSLDKAPLFLELRNGYDFDLITEPEIQKDVFRITYAGTFHGAMNPNLFLQAMAHFKKLHPEKKFEVNFYCGRDVSQIPSEIAENVKCHNKVKYEKLSEVLKESSLLLLIQAISERKGVFSGKTFDYLAVNRPLLALVSEKDVAADLIRHCRAGYICDHTSALSSLKLAEFIEKIYTDWKENSLPLRNWELIKQQSREVQISKLISALKVSR